MQTTYPGLEAIPDAMRAPIRELADTVQQIARDDARALVLFGSIAAGSFDARRHTARSVLVLDSVALDGLRQLAERGTHFGKKHLAAPLIMTPAYIDASRDTFPLELIEIHQNHLVVFGEDPFTDLQFADGDVRLQCERELKTILIGLRQGLLAAAGRDDDLARVEMGTADRLLRVLRGLLWLKDRRDPQTQTLVMQEVETLYNRKLPGLRNALDPNAEHGWTQFTRLYQDVEELGGAVDAA